MNTIRKSMFFQFSSSLQKVLFGILLKNTSTYMLIAYLTIYMSVNLQFDPGSIGVVMTISLISQRGFTFLGGVFADKIGLKKMLILGLLTRSIGYFSYLFAREFHLLLLSSAIVGIGGAMMQPPLSATVAVLAGDNRVQGFTYQNIADHVAATIGPIIGSLIYAIHFESIFIITSLMHLIFILLLRKVKYPKKHTSTHNVSNKESISIILKNKPLVLFTLAISSYWYLQTQFTLTIPLYITDFSANDALIGWIMSFNGLLIICFQSILLTLLQRFLQKESIILLGQTSMIISFCALLILPFPISLLFFTLFFSIGGMSIIPMIDALTVEMASKEQIASYIGFVSFGWAIGGTAGNLTGGMLYELFRINNNISFLWLTYIIIGSFSTVFLWAILKRT